MASTKSDIPAWQRAIHEVAKEKGWWDEPRNTGEIIALTHSELSEALEGARAGNPPSDKIKAYSSLEEELADVVIRILDWAEHDGLDIVGAMEAKLDYNRGRDYKHGKKF